MKTLLKQMTGYTILALVFGAMFVMTATTGAGWCGAAFVWGSSIALTAIIVWAISLVV